MPLIKSFVLFKNKFKELLKFAVIIFVPIAILTYLLTNYWNQINQAEMLSNIWFWLSFSSYAIVLLMATCWFSIAVIYLGEGYSFNQTLRLSVRKIIPVSLLTILHGLLVFLGLLFFIIPGIYLSVKLTLDVPFCVIKNQTPIQAMKNSYKMTTDFGWEIFGYSVVLMIGILAVNVGLVVLSGWMNAFFAPSLLGDLAKMANSTVFRLITQIVNVLYIILALTFFSTITRKINKRGDDGFVGRPA